MSGWASMILDSVARVIVKAVNPSGKTQFFKVEDEAPNGDEEPDLVELESIQHFGFASNPALGSEAIAVNVGADPGHSVVIASQHKDYQPRNLAEGEVCLYTKDGIKVHCKADGITYVGDEPSDFVALANKVLAELNDIRTKFNAHVHTSAAPSSPTTTPTTPMGSAGSVAATQLKAK